MKNGIAPNVPTLDAHFGSREREFEHAIAIKNIDAVWLAMSHNGLPTEARCVLKGPPSLVSVPGELRWATFA